MDYIRFYHLRTYDRINAPPSFVKEIESNSGVTFFDAQVALVREWLGPENGEWHQQTVSIAVPKETTGNVETMGTSDKDKPLIKAVDFPGTVQEASSIIQQFQQGATRDDSIIADTVGQHAMLDVTNLADEQWLGTPQEELDAYVKPSSSPWYTEESLTDDSFPAMYPSSSTFIQRLAASPFRTHRFMGTDIIWQCMIVDDRRVIVSLCPHRGRIWTPNRRHFHIDGLCQSQ